MIEVVRVIYERRISPEDMNSANAEPTDRSYLTAAQRENIRLAGAAALCTEAEISGTMCTNE